jgi:hypothetical protein
VVSDCPALGFNPEATCEDGLLKFYDGFWHDGLVKTDNGFFEHEEHWFLRKETRFYTCNCPTCCFVNSSTGVLDCAHGSDGVLCGLCREGFYRNNDLTCSPCGGADEDVLPTVFFVLAVLAIGGIIIGLNRNKASTAVQMLMHWWMQFQTTLSYLKQLVSFFQVVCLFKDVYDIPFPHVSSLSKHNEIMF